jgi:hypothetical protein
MRFSGAVGYATSTETAPGVWRDVIEEKMYIGDVVRDTRRLDQSSLAPPALNANIALGNSFSILADPYAYDNFMNMRYIRWNGDNWTITLVEIKRPRLILTVGDLWNGNTA